MLKLISFHPALLMLSVAFTGMVNRSEAQSLNDTYEVYALKFGERTHFVPLAEVAVGCNDPDSVRVFFMYWLLKGTNGKTILVDAGFTADAEINPKFISYSSPDKMLEKLNIRPSDITDIIITHPHWDHIGGIDLFPEAQVWMQRQDYDYFVGAAWQTGGNQMGFNKADVEKIVRRNLNGKLTLVNGDSLSILPGIRVFTGSKHTFESQYVLVESSKGPVLIASDNSWYYYNLTHLLPIPITHDAAAYTRNLKRMSGMVQSVDLVIPGHDPLVFTKYPMVAPDVVRIR